MTPAPHEYKYGGEAGKYRPCGYYVGGNVFEPSSYCHREIDDPVHRVEPDGKEKE